MPEGNRAKARAAVPQPAAQVVDLPSTTWRWRTVRIARPPEARTARGPKGLHTWVGRTRWDLRNERITIKVRYRGGPEAYYEVEARGATARLTGVVALHDLMLAICHHT